MMSKASLMVLVLAAMRVQAQDFIDHDVYSVENCDPDPNDLEVQSFQLSYVPEVDDKGQEYSACMKAGIGLPDWPRGDEGRFKVWIDTDKFGTGCSMNFYRIPGSDEEGDSWACSNGLYRRVQKDKTGCGQLELTESFGYAYCCGSICNDDILDWPTKRDMGSTAASAPGAKRDHTPLVKDVTKAKRGPVLPKRQNDKCIINLKSEPYTTYGRQIKMGPDEFCQPDQTTCGNTWTYTAGTEISTTVSHEDSTEVGWSEYVVFVNTITDGYSFTKGESEQRSISKNLAAAPGHSGYPTFTPLLMCAEADLSGDCSREKLHIGDGEVCVQKYLPGDVPDGSWEMVITD